MFNILEASFEVMLVNAQHIKAVPGRKTDVKDAQWIAELLQHGLLRPSFIPPLAQRDLRDLTRHRTNFIRERVNLVNRIQKVLEAANIKLASVASDVMGVSGRAMLNAIVAGQTNPVLMADLAKGRLSNKRDQLVQALEGRVRPHQRFILAELLCQLDSIDETIIRFNQEIQKYCNPFESVVELLDTIPGVGRQTAEMILAEIGVDMSRFPSEAHLSSWAKVSSGNNESAGRRRSGKTTEGSRWLRAAIGPIEVPTSHRVNGISETIRMA